MRIWHGLTGKTEQAFQELFSDFRQRHPNISVQIIPKGNYVDTLNSLLSASKLDDLPELIQIYEGGTVDAGSTPFLEPLASWRTQLQFSLEEENSRFLPSVFAFYASGTPKTLTALPFSTSTPILFYNKTILTKHKLQPPKTWEEFEVLARRLFELKERPLLVSGWLSGHHVDQIGAIHNQEIATHGNGIDNAKAARLQFNPFFVEHLGKLVEWQRLGFFAAEHGPSAENAFAEGRALFISQGSNRLADLRHGSKGRFEIGVAAFPYWEKHGKPHNTIGGGSAFWVVKKPRTPERDRALVAVLNFLGSDHGLAQWQHKTSYIASLQTAFYKEQLREKDTLKAEAEQVALASFLRSAPTTHSRGILLPHFTAIRQVMVLQMERALRGEISATEAVKNWVNEGNKLLEK